MNNQIIIEQVENGVIITSWYYDKDNKQGEPIYEQLREVIEEEEDKKLMEKTMMAIIKKMGYSYDRYGKENVKISWDRKGSKVY